MSKNLHLQLGSIVVIFSLVLTSASLSRAGYEEGRSELSEAYQTHPRKRKRTAAPLNSRATQNSQSEDVTRPENILPPSGFVGPVKDKQAQIHQIYRHLVRLIALVNHASSEQLTVGTRGLNRSKIVLTSQAWFNQLVELRDFDYAPILAQMDQILDSDPLLVQVRKLHGIIFDFNTQVESWPSARKSLLECLTEIFQTLEVDVYRNTNLSHERVYQLKVMAQAWVGKLQAHVDHREILTQLTQAHATQNSNQIISTLENLIYSHPLFAREQEASVTQTELTQPALKVPDIQPKGISPKENDEPSAKLPRKKQKSIGANELKILRMKDIKKTCSLTEVESRHLGSHAELFTSTCRKVLNGLRKLHEQKSLSIRSPSWLRLNEFFVRIKWFKEDDFSSVLQSFQNLAKLNLQELIHFYDEFHSLFSHKDCLFSEHRAFISHEVARRFNKIMQYLKLI